MGGSSDPESVPPRPGHPSVPAEPATSATLTQLYPADWLASEYYARGGHLADSRFAASMQPAHGSVDNFRVASSHPTASSPTSHGYEYPEHPSKRAAPRAISSENLSVVGHSTHMSPAPKCRSPSPSQLVTPPHMGNEDHISESMCVKLRLASPQPHLDSSRNMHDWPNPSWARPCAKHLSHEHIGPQTESSADFPTTPSSLAAYEGCGSQHHGSMAGGSPDGSFGFLGSVASMSSMALDSVASPTGRSGSGSGGPSNPPSVTMSLRCASARSDRSGCSSTKLPGVCGLGSRPGSVKRSGSQSSRLGLQQHHNAVLQQSVRHGSSAIPGANAWPMDRAARIGEQMVMKAAEHGLHGSMSDGQLSGYVEVPGGIMWPTSTAQRDPSSALNF